MGGEHVVFGADVAQASGLRRVNRLGRRHRRTLRRRRRRRAGRQDRLPPSGRPARRPGARPARMASVDVGQDGSRPTHADAVDHLRTLDQRLPPERSLRRRALVLDAEQAWPGSSGRAVEGQDTRRQDVGRGDGGGCSGGTGAGGFRGSGRLFHPEEGAFELARLEIEEGGERRVEPALWVGFISGACMVGGVGEWRGCWGKHSPRDEAAAPPVGRGKSQSVGCACDAPRALREGARHLPLTPPPFTRSPAPALPSAPSPRPAPRLSTTSTPPRPGTLAPSVPFPSSA
eukprot:scaffold10071_cov90-Isochrysis_galbana.AAC.3